MIKMPILRCDYYLSFQLDYKLNEGNIFGSQGLISTWY